MKFEKTILTDHQVKISVELDTEELNEQKLLAARKISRNSKISGFRPGKAPFDVVKRIYGEEMIEEEAIELLINKIYPDLLDEADIKPYAAGKLEEIVSKDPPKFTLLIPLQPAVTLNDYQSVRLPYQLDKVDQSEIDKVIANLQKNYATAEPVERPSVKGDLVTVKITADLTKPEKEENPRILTDTPFQQIAGEEDDREQFPFVGFSEKLIGVSEGQKLNLKHKYPKDSAFENLQGKEVAFEITVESVKNLIKPELNEDFAKLLGFETVEMLLDSVKTQLNDAKQNEYDREYFDQLISTLQKKAEILYPPQMLEDEIKDVLSNFEGELAKQNMDLDTYLKINNREKDDFIDKEIRPAAEKRLEHALILEEVSRQEKIELDKDELQKIYSRSLMEMQSSSNFRDLQKKFTTRKLANAMLMQSATGLMNRQTLTRLKQIAAGQLEKDQPADENMKPD